MNCKLMDGGSWNPAAKSRHIFSNVSRAENIGDQLKNKGWVTHHKTEWRLLHLLPMLALTVLVQSILKREERS